MLGNEYSEYYSKTNKPNATCVARCRRLARRNRTLLVVLLAVSAAIAVLTVLADAPPPDTSAAEPTAAERAAAAIKSMGTVPVIVPPDAGAARVAALTKALEDARAREEELRAQLTSRERELRETSAEAVTKRKELESLRKFAGRMESEADRAKGNAEAKAKADAEAEAKADARAAAESQVKADAVAKAKAEAEAKAKAKADAEADAAAASDVIGTRTAESELRGTPPPLVGEDAKDEATAEGRRKAVVDEFLWAYRAYERDAWGKDELHPLSHRGDGGFDMGLTIVDSLDTMWLMGLKDDFRKGVDWVRDHLRIGHQKDINLFETTIRILGGLLAAYGLSGEQVLLDRARELGDKLIFAFDSPTGLPYGTVDWTRKRAYNPTWQGGASSVSEVGTLQLEWSYLSRVTGDPKYAEKADQVMRFFDEHPMADGLYPLWINPDSGRQNSDVISFGSRADSIYEYFIKQFVMSRGRNTRAKRLYDASMDGMVRRLIRKSSPSGLTYIQELKNGQPFGKFDHLVCFVPGMLALGVQPSVGGPGNANNPKREEHMRLARELAETCYQFYKRSPTGLAPEIIQFRSNADVDFVIDPGARHNLLRPETVESLFVMWRVTGDEKYREQGWEIFKSFRKHGRVASGGYSSLRNVEHDGGPDNFKDKMESFFLGETLKYLYLMFADESLVPLDKYVFNTEAHPLPIEDA